VSVDSTCPVETSTGEVGDRDGEIERLRGIVAQLGKLAELGKMTASLVHEMNQPLMGIKSFAQIVLRRLVETDPNHAKLKIIEEQARVLEAMVSRLRVFSRQASFRRQAVSVVQVVSSVLGILEYQLGRRGVRIEWVGDPPNVFVASDPHQLQQVVINLFVNARDAVEGCDEARRTVRLVHGGVDDGKDYRLVVVDDGDGVPDDVRDRVFELFFTTKDAERGTGLGLTISREIIEGFGGTLRLLDRESTARLPGGGTTAFEVVLPVWADSKPTSSHA
jgi:C4-dicarboxylate-specific signal transduction histidine kinase